MSLPPELEAKILRYYHVEKWRIGTIARQLHVHHETVQRVLRRAGIPPPERAARPSKVDPYLPFIRETLERFPTLTASRIYAMVRERGYRGSPDRFRHIVALHRPQRPAEAYLRLTTMPGEMGQADWGHFGHLQIGRARRPLMAFVLVLSWSRQIFLQFFFDARMESFLRGHIAAFGACDGLPRIVLYDNLKSAVLERQGDAIRFHPTMLEFAGHYRYEPRRSRGATDRPPTAFAQPPANCAFARRLHKNKRSCSRCQIIRSSPMKSCRSISPRRRTPASISMIIAFRTPTCRN